MTNRVIDVSSIWAVASGFITIQLLNWAFDDRLPEFLRASNVDSIWVVLCFALSLSLFASRKTRA